MTIRLRDDTLKKSLKQDGLKPLYFITGNEPYLISLCSRLVQKTVNGEVEKLDFSLSTNEEVEAQLASYSFTEKVIIIDNFKASDYDSEKEKLYGSLLDDIPPSLTVIVKAFVEGNYFSVSKSAENFVSLCPDAVIVTCEKKNGDELVKYVCAFAKNIKTDMSYDCARELIRLRGDDLFLLSGEIKKLGSACGYTEITLDLINRMCPKTTEDNVFDFVKACEKGNTKDAISLFYDIMEQEQSPHQVVAAIASSYINLSRVEAAKSAGVQRGQMEADFGYKKGDRALGIAYDKGNRFSREKLDAVISLLYDINARLTSSAEDKQTLIERGMVKLCAIMSGRI